MKIFALLRKYCEIFRPKERNISIFSEKIISKQFQLLLPLQFHLSQLKFLTIRMSQPAIITFHYICNIKTFYILYCLDHFPIFYLPINMCSKGNIASLKPEIAFEKTLSWFNAVSFGQPKQHPPHKHSHRWRLLKRLVFF